MKVSDAGRNLVPGTWTACLSWLFVLHIVSRRKNIQSSIDNFDKVTRIFTIFGTHCPSDAFF